MTKFVRQSIQVQTSQQIIDSFSTHLSDEFVWIIILKILIIFRKCIKNIQILFFRKQIIFSYAIFSFHTRLNNNITFVVYNRIQFLCRQSEQITDFIRKRTEIPDVSHRHNQLDMSHTFTAHFLFSNFHTTTVADDTFITDTLVFTAMTFIILDRTKNALAEQTVTFGFVRTIINGFRLQNFTTRILKDFFRRSQTN